MQYQEPKQIIVPLQSVAVVRYALERLIRDVNVDGDIQEHAKIILRDHVIEEPKKTAHE